MVEITIAAFDIDERNRAHFGSHGIDDMLIYEVWLGPAHYRGIRHLQPTRLHALVRT